MVQRKDWWQDSPVHRAEPARRTVVRTRASRRRSQAAVLLPLADAVATGRVVVGLVLLARPGVLGRGLRVARPQEQQWVVRMMAVRDLALGVGALATRRAPAGRAFLLAGLVSDGVDALVVAQAAGRGQVAAGRGALVTAAAAGAVAVQAGALAGALAAT